MAALLGAAITVGFLATAGQGATPSPRHVYEALLKAPPPSSLPPALKGARTHAAPLSAGSRKQHAIGAVEITNGEALVGFLVFPTHAHALADLRAFPPARGPNKIVSRDLPGFPRPTYVLRATGNGYLAAYVVFIERNVLVDCWAYGKKSSQKRLLQVDEQVARWALAHSARATAGR
jgi:hypothetical protein